MYFHRKSDKTATAPGEEPIKTFYRQNQTALYFPPPPTSISDPKRKASRQPKPPQYKDAPPKTTLTPFLRRQNSQRHRIGYPTQSRRKRLQEVHLPAIKLSPRHWTLITLLLLSFIVLILGFIFADCVALPHTNRKDGITSEDIADQVSLYVRQVDSKPNASSDDPTTTTTPKLNPSTASVPDAGVNGTAMNSAGPQNVEPASTSQSNTTSPAEYLANESKRMGFDSPKNLAILFFYTATLPLLTIFHTMAELITLYCAKRHSSRKGAAEDADDDNNSISNLKRSSPTKDHDLSLQTSGKFGSILPFLPALSLTASVLLICGWVTINSIQIYCEIPIPSITSKADRNNQLICPVQTRGHFMHGIHELSIVKNAFAWLLVTIYIGYAVWCIRINGLVWAAAKEERRARKQNEEIEGKRAEQLRQSVVKFGVVDEETGGNRCKGEKKAPNVRIAEV